MAAAISGSACSREAVKNESGAEAVLAEVILRISPPPQPFGGLRSVLCGVRKHARSTTSPRPGQAFAVRGQYLCKIWWGLGIMEPASVRAVGAPNERPRPAARC